MWIKWKYNDHGHPDFKTLEIPDDFDGYESVEEYLCEQRLVPVWSERFMAVRIKWKEIAAPIPTKEQLEWRIKSLKDDIKTCQEKIRINQKLLKSL